MTCNGNAILHTLHTDPQFRVTRVRVLVETILTKFYLSSDQTLDYQGPFPLGIRGLRPKNINLQLFKALFSNLICYVNDRRYGFYGDVITESEKYRWMGPKRYDYAGTMVFLKHRYRENGYDMMFDRLSFKYHFLNFMFFFFCTF